jgi:hypothetical protein
VTTTFHHTSTAASRKPRVCDWCGEAIAVGEPYEGYGYNTGYDRGYVTMHPECMRAMEPLAVEEGSGMTWDVGEFSRGCGCQRGDCRCEKGK